jgi:hypothetical protein
MIQRQVSFPEDFLLFDENLSNENLCTITNGFEDILPSNGDFMGSFHTHNESVND